MNVSDTRRCTVLSEGGASVSTVEHLLSAFCGLGVSDALVDVEGGSELPIGDGGAKVWTDAIASAGIVSTGPADIFTLSEPLLVPGKGGAFLAAYPSERLSVTAAAVFEHPLVGTQTARFFEGENYATQIAPARTFGFEEEIEALRAAGLALGGSLDNAVVVYPDRYSAPLRFPNEFARHKLLDVLGDLFLIGFPLFRLRADIIAVKPSHRLNTEFAAHLAPLCVSASCC